MKRKKLLNILLFLFSVTVLSFLSVKELKAVNINLGSQGSNDMGAGGKKGTWWKAGDYGIRFTVINRKSAERIGRSIDYFRLNDYKSNEVFCSKGINKLEYMYLKNKNINDVDVRPYNHKKGGYGFQRDDIWNVITVGNSRKTSLKDIKKKYLSSDTFLARIAKDMGGGMTLEKIKSKDNTLMFEPIYYFHLDGKYFALTATEIALYDIVAKMQGKNTIYNGHYSFSHKAIPLSAYLKKERYRIPSYKKGVRVFSNQEIATTMGVGMLRGKGGEKKRKPKIKVFDYKYRVDTDVYTSVSVTPGNDATPDDPIVVYFDIPGVGRLSSGNIYAPKGISQLAWVKWRTPKTEKEMDIVATVIHGGRSESKSLSVEIDKKPLWEPLNPKADDKKPLNLSDFDMNYKPQNADITNPEKREKLSWTKWEVTYQPNGDFIGWEGFPIFSEKGKVIGVSYSPKFDNDPYYAFGKHQYQTSYAPNGAGVTYMVNGRTPTEPIKFSVTLKTSEMNVYPASTASRANPDKRYIKSGYGISVALSTKLSGSGVADCTGFQTSRYFFPEFNYKKYWRWGDRMVTKREFQTIKDSFSLPKNHYSYSGYKGTSDGRFHFLPIWYPDGIYDVYAEVSDAWTPAGEIKSNMIGEITCKGALWDDWHIQPGR